MTQVKNKYRFSKRNAFLRTMLLSTVALICIPLICVQLLMIKQSTDEFKSSNETAYFSALQTNARTFNSQMELLNDIVLQMSLDDQITNPLRKNANAYTTLKAAKAIQGYTDSQPYAELVGVYYKTHGFVLQNGCKSPINLFCDSIAKGNPECRTQLRTFLDEINAPSTFSPGNYGGSSDMIYAKPVSLVTALDRDAVVFFVLDSEYLVTLFEASIPYEADFAILSGSGQPLLSSSTFPAGLFDRSDFIAFQNELDAVTLDLTDRPEQLLVYKYTDASTDNIFLAAVGKDNAEQNLTVYVSGIHRTVFFSLVLMCLLLVVMVYINYLPVKKLVARHAAHRVGSNLSELELLDSAFFAKDERISNQRDLLSTFLLGDLISGAKPDKTLLEEYFPPNRYSCFAVAAVLNAHLNSEQANDVTTILRESLEICDVYATSMPNRPEALFVLMSSEQLDAPVIKDRLLLTLWEVTDRTCEVRMGEPVSQLRDIRRSYQTTLVRSLSLADVDGLEGELPYPNQDIRAFMQLVCSGDRDRAIAALDRLEQEICQPEISPSYQNYYCYRMIFAYLSGTQDNAVTLSREEIDQLLSFTRSDQLFELTRASVVRYCDRLAAVEQDSSTQNQKKLLQYVNDNLTNCELCLSSAADHMNISIYAVSRLFKEGAKQNFKEYVTTKRLELAYDMLLSTEDSIEQISRSVGFENRTYFSTVFKKRYGVAPTAVRSSEQ